MGSQLLEFTKVSQDSPDFLLSDFNNEYAEFVPDFDRFETVETVQQ